VSAKEGTGNPRSAIIEQIYLPAGGKGAAAIVEGAMAALHLSSP
jgi:hypothetical protein